MKPHVINLNRSPDRLEYVNRVSSALGLEFFSRRLHRYGLMGPKNITATTTAKTVIPCLFG